MARAAIFEIQLIHELRKIDTGNTGLVESLIDMFEESIEGEMEQLHQLVEDGDIKGAARLAHTLRSTSGNLGAAAFSEICHEMEEAVLRMSPSQAEATLGELLQELDQILPATRQQIRRCRLMAS